MNDTKCAIIRASRLPMSIIIVGIGSCSFEKMVEFNSDDKKLRIDLDVAAHDIVQFVPFRQFAMDSTLLAKEVLPEVPNQLTEYMRLKGLSPHEGVGYKRACPGLFLKWLPEILLIIHTLLLISHVILRTSW